MDLPEFHRTVMERPYRFQVFDTITKNWTFQDEEPRLDELQTYQPTADPNTRVLMQTKTAYIDTRYNARMRLYTYARKKYGLPIHKYRPYAGTEIGKTIPILNF
jgi:hypothetical protein